MTNNEIRRNDETLMTKTGTARLRSIRHSCFGFLSSSGFRNSSFQERLHLQLAHEERPPVRGFLDDFARGFAGTVTGPRFDPDKNWGVAGLGGLETGGGFETVR